MAYTTLNKYDDSAIAQTPSINTNRVDAATVDITSTLGDGRTYRVNLPADGLAIVEYSAGETLSDEPNQTTVAYERRGETYAATEYEGGPIEIPNIVLSVVREGHATPATADPLPDRHDAQAARYRYVESESDPLKKYTIGTTKDGEPLVCSCKGYTYTGNCKHITDNHDDTTNTIEA